LLDRVRASLLQTSQKKGRETAGVRFRTVSLASGVGRRGAGAFRVGPDGEMMVGDTHDDPDPVVDVLALDLEQRARRRLAARPRRQGQELER
jgi:hypothetical protein